MSDYSQKMDGLKEINDDAWNLYRVISQDADVDENDWGHLGRVCERIEHVRTVLVWNWSYPYLLSQIEDEKSRFILNKEWNKVYKASVIPEVKSILDISKQWKFNDYRIVNLQNDLRRWAQEMYDFLLNDDQSQEHYD